MAWGDSLPHVPDPKNPPKNQRPRRESEDIDYPDIGEFGYIADKLLSRIGIAKPSSGFSGSGITKLDWSDIESWKNLTGAELTAFEVEMIKLLSAKYVEMFNLSNQTLMPSPYVDVDSIQEKLDSQVTQIFSNKRK